jgi:hypothetical protein
MRRTRVPRAGVRQDPLVEQGPGDVVQPETLAASCSAWVGFTLPPWPAAAAVHIPRPASNSVADLVDADLDGLATGMLPGPAVGPHPPVS